MSEDPVLAVYLLCSESVVRQLCWVVEAEGTKEGLLGLTVLHGVLLRFALKLFQCSCLEFDYL